MTDQEPEEIRTRSGFADGEGNCLQCGGSGHADDEPGAADCATCQGAGWFGLTHADADVLLEEVDRLRRENARLAALVGDRCLDSDLAQEAVRRERGRVGAALVAAAERLLDEAAFCAADAPPTAAFLELEAGRLRRLAEGALMSDGA